MSEDVTIKAINQLRAVVEKNPNDESAQFELGGALMAAAQYQDAAQAFQRVLALNSQRMKAHELLGAAQKECGNKELAIQTLRNGCIAARKLGNAQAMKTMGDMLADLGATAPGTDERPQAGDESGWSCCRCSGPGPRLEQPPFKGELGQKVFAHVCSTCWAEWIQMGTRVINELRLPMYDPAAQKMYDEHMVEFLSLK
ncbi:MAG: Fe(2+)-trafficking protein [Phycisphaerae bacterium]